ncbi:MAG: cyclase family protein [Wenzhouxiangella sp.]
MNELIDLSHEIEDGLITYRGLPAPIVCDYLSREASKAQYDEGTSFHIGRIDMVANTGTYVDSPFHRHADGKDLSELELEKLAELEGICLDARGLGRAIGPELFEGRAIEGRAVLVHTGWSRHWASDAYFEGHPHLTGAAAQYLRDAGAVLVGIDSYNIDDTEDGERPVHTILLGADIPIAEHLCRLDRLPETGFRFHAAPVKVRGMGTFPVRAYAVVEESGDP